MTITADDVRLADRGPQLEKAFREAQAAQEKLRLEEVARVSAFQLAHAAREGAVRAARMEWEKSSVVQGKIRHEVSGDIRQAAERAGVELRGHEGLLKRRKEEKEEKEGELARRQKEAAEGRVIVGRKENVMVDPLSKEEVAFHEAEISVRRDRHREEFLKHKVLEEELRKTTAAVEAEVLRIRKAALTGDKRPEKAVK